MLYLDNAATSFPKAPGVSAAMCHYLDDVGANIGRASYGASLDAALVALQTRQQLCSLFNFDETSHTLFTPGQTASLNMVVKGFVHAGDHVVTSSLEHNSVMRPLTQIGARISRIPADEYGLVASARSAEEQRAHIESVLEPTTKLVIVNHASNVSGSLQPVALIGKICAERHIPFVLDAAQTAGHYPLDFAALNLSALCVPAHKGLLGPQGIGALLLTPAFAQALKPLIVGGTGSASDSEQQPTIMPDRFEAGTLNLPGIFGMHAALSFVEQQTITALRKHEQQLCEHFIDGLREIDNLEKPSRVRIAGPLNSEQRVGVFSLDFIGRDNAEATFLLEQDYGILTRCGLHCSPSAHKTLSTFPQGSVRFSFGYTTTLNDIDTALAAIEQIAL